MHHVVTYQALESLEQFAQECERFLLRQPPLGLYVLLEVASVAVLAYQVQMFFRHLHIEEAHYVIVFHELHVGNLVPKSLEVASRLRHHIQPDDLDGDLFLGRVVYAEVHFPVRALPDGLSSIINVLAQSLQHSYIIYYNHGLVCGTLEACGSFCAWKASGTPASRSEPGLPR